MGNCWSEKESPSVHVGLKKASSEPAWKDLQMYMEKTEILLNPPEIAFFLQCCACDEDELINLETASDHWFWTKPSSIWRRDLIANDNIVVMWETQSSNPTILVPLWWKDGVEHLWLALQQLYDFWSSLKLTQSSVDSIFMAFLHQLVGAQLAKGIGATGWMHRRWKMYEKPQGEVLEFLDQVMRDEPYFGRNK